MSDTDIAWAAGLYEGEGSCIALKINDKWGAKRRYPRISLGMTDEDVVWRFHSIMGVGRVTANKPRPGRKQMWTYQCTRREDCLSIIERLRPYLGTRRLAQVDAVIAECATSELRGPKDHTGMQRSEASKQRMRDAWTRRKVSA